MKVIVTKEDGGTFGLLAKRTRPGEKQRRRLTGLSRKSAKSEAGDLVRRTKTGYQPELSTE